MSVKNHCFELKGVTNTWVKHNLSGIMLMVGVILLAGCATTKRPVPEIPEWSFSPEMIFPADQSLNRPEDGVVLSDGLLVVADQVSGLRLVQLDGSSRPFGDFAAAGYVHKPPQLTGGANGVTLDPSGKHILVSDVYRGGIYRVDVATEVTTKIYQHNYGVNMARADRQGGIWFTQSTQNRAEHGQQELYRAVGVAIPDGALFYLPKTAAGHLTAAIKLVDGLNFANGLALDEKAGYLYLAETLKSRVLRFNLDVAAGKVSNQMVLLAVNGPDNIELDRHNRLWVASPVRNEITVFNLDTLVAETVFEIKTNESRDLAEMIDARMAAGVSWLDLLNPALWEPGPGFITGMMLSPDDGPVYVTGLGQALIRLPR